MTETPTTGDSSPRSPRPRWLNVLLYLLAWVVVIGILTAQTSLGIELGWSQSFVRIFRDWGPWILLGTVLWWLVTAYPLFGKKKHRHIAIHIAASLLTLVVAECLVAFVFYPVSQPLAEKSQMSARDLMRGIRGERVRPIARVQDYRLRTRTIARKAQIWLLLYWVFALIGTAVLQRRFAEERARRALLLQNDLVQARFRELQSRLNPHFLFNVLNSISALIIVDPQKAESMVNQLSGLLRRVLTHGEQALIPLSEELELLRDYLSIEQVRFSDRLTIREEIDESLTRASIPPLTLQPIAENAIKHGIEPKSEPSTLEVIIQGRENGQVEIKLADDGVGFADAEQSSGLGIGLKNVRDRLENVFPGETELSVALREEEGTIVTIRIPRHVPEVIS